MNTLINFYKVKVIFSGGSLSIKWNGNKKESIVLNGTAKFIFSGTY